jgi:hypothetical protein
MKRTKVVEYYVPICSASVRYNNVIAVVWIKFLAI